MRPKFPPSNDHAKILDYWGRRRHGLNESEWTDFYRLVHPLLMGTQLPPEYADRARRREVADMFFAEKVFLNAAASQAGSLESVYALHTYLKRYVMDLQRKAGPTAGSERAGEEATSAAQDVESAAAASVSHAQILFEAGIDLERAIASAEEFLAGLDQGEAAYLGYHSCAEPEDREPISRIAERFALGSSYHYKARSLGITRSKGETYAGYEKTKIGRWLQSLGARLNEEWQEELAVLLTLICLKVHERLGKKA